MMNNLLYHLNEFDPSKYEIVEFKDDKEKEEFFNKYDPFEDNRTMDDEIRCIHCGETYKVKDFVAIKAKDGGYYVIVCKNFPKCNGSIIDWFPVKK